MCAGWSPIFDKGLGLNNLGICQTPENATQAGSRLSPVYGADKGTDLLVDYTKRKPDPLFI